MASSTQLLFFLCVYACVFVEGVRLRPTTKSPASGLRISAEQRSATESPLAARTGTLHNHIAVSAPVQSTGFLADATTSPAVSPWFLNPISINIPIPNPSAGSIPVVLLPVPVPMQSECRAPALQMPIHRQTSEKAAPVDHTPQLDPGYEEPEEIDRTNLPLTTSSPTHGTSKSVPLEFPGYVVPKEIDQGFNIPPLTTNFTSEELVQLFLSQTPRAPYLPPLLLSAHDQTVRQVDAGPSPQAPEAHQPSQAAPVSHPQKPSFSSSLQIEAELRVPSSDYTERYKLWFDGGSKAARVEFHDGSSATYRTFSTEGKVKRFEVLVDRSSEANVRRCARAEPSPATPTDRIPPGLPDIRQFEFEGYVETENNAVPVERWGRIVAGAEGELGAAKKERLTARHELLLTRTTTGNTVPIQYTVTMNSSLLGENVDFYQHRYMVVNHVEIEQDFFKPNIEELCDRVERLDNVKPEQLARLEPLREFTQMPARDTRYDQIFDKFKAKYGRVYKDAREEAVRKSAMVTFVRFINSANRQGSTARYGINNFCDRVDAELQQMLGVEIHPGDIDNAEPFPYSRREVSRREPRLPDRFDWRPRGVVSPVKRQVHCESCWAFAVSGAVEGSLALRTGQLVPLSPQNLVDCAHPFGGRGCKGTWPSHAYDYTRERGLRADEEYTYTDSVNKCLEESVQPVTRISGHVNVTRRSVPALKVAIKQHGPTVVIIDGLNKAFITYSSGVHYDERCGNVPRPLNHAVLAVGWGKREGEEFLTIKNSWGADWGEHGFARLQSRSNTCGVLNMPSYPLLHRQDVLRKDLKSTRVVRAEE
ncbi:uncharacterized protein LOC123707679 [Pieris brassicae]|uniref:uncharacterized protein LOC123707679 n=1 Tax=Pieris brassicae TaxID=7116 RepID=UPI001E65EC89|nr:uncharacterized protein LOC123707679 [Pieris brassicae]